MKKKLFKHQEGFTLVEVIISIAVLGLICAVVLKLFVLANEVSKRSRIEDVASIQATNTIEVCKLADSLQEVKAHPYFAKAKLKEDDLSNLSGVISFDKNWHILSPEVLSETIYQLRFTLTNNEDIVIEDAVLMDIIITINEIDKKTMSEKTILEYNTRKYFSLEE